MSLDLNEVVRLLAAGNIPSPRLEARILLEHIGGSPFAEVDGEAEQKLRRLVDWAKYVLASSSPLLQIRATLPLCATFSAKLIPAIPEPITRKSNFLTIILLFLTAKLQNKLLRCTFRCH